MAQSQNAINQIPDNYLKYIYQGLGSPVIACNYWAGAFVSNANISLVDGRMYGQAVYIPAKTVITGAGFILNSLGSYTADNNNKVGLYSISGTTYTKVAESTDDGNLWQSGSADTLQQKAFSSTYTAEKGVYYVTFLYNTSSGTAPSLRRYSGLVTAGFLSLGASNIISWSLNSQTDLPTSTTAASVTNNTTPLLAYLY